MKRNQRSVKDLINGPMARIDHYQQEPNKFDGDAFRGGNEPNPGVATQNTQGQEPAQGGNEPATPKPGIQTDPQQTPQQVQQQATEIDDPYWKVLSKRLSSEERPYDVPEIIRTGKKQDGTPLTPEERFGLLTSEVLKNASYSQDPQVDQIVRNIIAASAAKEEFNIAEHLNELRSSFKDYSKMSVDDRLFEHYKNRYGKKEGDADGMGMDDEAIRSELKKMTEFQKRDTLDKISQEQNYAIAQQTQAYTKQYNEGLSNILSQVKQEDNQLIENYLSEVRSLNKVSGFDLSEAELNEFLNEAPGFFEKKIVDGQNGFNEITSEVAEVLNGILSDAKQSLALLPLLWMIKKGKIMGYTSQIKESQKRREEGKLGDNPGYSSSSGHTPGFDSERFREGN